ncbi:MAG: hypothetical protein ACYTHN_12850, partial [Planctomycetota bacterium]
ESPRVMTGVLVTLAVLSLICGFIWLPGFIPGAQWRNDFMGLRVQGGHGAHAAKGGHGEHHTGTEILAMIVSVIIALGASGLGVFVFTKRRALAQKLARETYLTRAFYRLSLNKFWVDEVYEALIIKPIYYVAIALWLLADMVLIDGLCVNGLGYLVKRTASVLRRLQSGLVNLYALVILFGAMAIIWFMLIKVL